MQHERNHKCVNKIKLSYCPNWASGTDSNDSKSWYYNVSNYQKYITYFVTYNQFKTGAIFHRHTQTYDVEDVRRSWRDIHLFTCSSFPIKACNCHSQPRKIRKIITQFIRLWCCYLYFFVLFCIIANIDTSTYINTLILLRQR